MIELRREPIPDQKLGPVKLALVQQWEGSELVGIEGIEVTFRESSPDMRNRPLFWFLFMLLLLGMSAGIYLLIVGLLKAGDWWGRGAAYLVNVHPDVAIAMAGTAIFIFLCFRLRPPFHSPVLVSMTIADDRLSIYRGGQLKDWVQTSQVMGAAVDPHPKLEESIVRAQADPRRSDNKALINRYKLAEVLYVHIGRGNVIQSRVEVAAFREGKSGRTAMRARSAIELARQMAMELRRKMEAAGGAAEGTDLEPAQGPVRRRRRDRME